jgi:hypothetical protein
MPLSGAKSQNFIATAILVSVVMLCWSAEAAPPNYGYKQIVKRGDVIIRYVRHYDILSPWTSCGAYNKSSKSWVCAVFDVYPFYSRPAHGTVTYQLNPKLWTPIFAASIDNQIPALQCKLSNAVYVPRYSPCP